MIFRFSAITTFLVLASVVSTNAKKPKNTDVENPCYDYSGVLGDVGYDECTGRKLYQRMKVAFKEQNAGTNVKCVGGFNRDMNAITNTVGQGQEVAEQTLQEMCDDALADSSDAMMSRKESFDFLESEPHSIDLELFFHGQGPLNEETGNFHQETKDFEKKGKDKFNYMGTDPRKNDHYATSDVSYFAGEAIFKFYDNEAKSAYLDAPTLDFEGGCQETNAAVCCWHRDRQYFDKNGNCGHADCANQAPGDNTDLCWMETDDEGPVPYPEDIVEGDLHCHGFAWSQIETDINTAAKNNNLFFVSMYDHMVTRGYVESITNDPNIAGEQAMCGCVEDMKSKLARADCTEAIGKTNYTAIINADTGKLEIAHKPDTYQIEFRACEGYDYDASISPKQFQEEYNYNREDAGLESSNNDLSAFLFKLFLRGDIDESHVEAYERTIVGYRDPTVNDGDDERQIVCKAKYEEEFGADSYPEISEE